MGSNPTLSARVRLGAAALGLGLALAALIISPAGAAERLSGQILRLGLGQGVEEQLLGQVSLLLLQRAGLTVETIADLGPEALRDRLTQGEIDVYWDYTGRALVAFQRNPDRGLLARPQACYEAVAKADAERGLAWGRMAQANNTYGLLVMPKTAQAWRVRTISDLAASLRKTPTKVKLGLEQEFQTRPDGFPALATLYGLDPLKVMLDPLPADQLLGALRAGKVEVSVGPVIDGRVVRFELVVLEEDKPFFPAYNPASVWRKEARELFPKAAGLLDLLAQALTAEGLNQLRYPVEIHNQPQAEAARDWLAKRNIQPR